MENACEKRIWQLPEELFDETSHVMNIFWHQLLTIFNLKLQKQYIITQSFPS